jgi:hypothetical protein
MDENRRMRAERDAAEAHRIKMQFLTEAAEIQARQAAAARQAAERAEAERLARIKKGEVGGAGGGAGGTGDTNNNEEENDNAGFGNAVFGIGAGNAGGNSGVGSSAASSSSAAVGGTKHIEQSQDPYEDNKLDEPELLKTGEEDQDCINEEAPPAQPAQVVLPAPSPPAPRRPSAVLRQQVVAELRAQEAAEREAQAAEREALAREAREARAAAQRAILKRKLNLLSSSPPRGQPKKNPAVASQQQEGHPLSPNAFKFTSRPACDDWDRQCKLLHSDDDVCYSCFAPFFPSDNRQVGAAWMPTYYYISISTTNQTINRTKGPSGGNPSADHIITHSAMKALMGTPPTQERGHDESDIQQFKSSPLFHLQKVTLDFNCFFQNTGDHGAIPFFLCNIVEGRPEFRISLRNINKFVLNMLNGRTTKIRTYGGENAKVFLHESDDSITECTNSAIFSCTVLSRIFGVKPGQERKYNGIRIDDLWKLKVLINLWARMNYVRRRLLQAAGGNSNDLYIIAQYRSARNRFKIGAELGNSNNEWNTALALDKQCSAKSHSSTIIKAANTESEKVAKSIINPSTKSFIGKIFGKLVGASSGAGAGAGSSSGSGSGASRNATIENLVTFVQYTAALKRVCQRRSLNEKCANWLLLLHKLEPEPFDEENEISNNVEKFIEELERWIQKTSNIDNRDLYWLSRLRDDIVRTGAGAGAGASSNNFSSSIMTCYSEIMDAQKKRTNNLIPLFRNLRNILPLNRIKPYLISNEKLNAAAMKEATRQHETALTASTAEINTLLTASFKSGIQININAKTIFEQREGIISGPIKLSIEGAELAKKEKAKHGSATGNDARQRKTRFRKRQTQKRKTRKNRKQRK